MTEVDAFNNTQVLKDFVEDFNLKDNHSNIFFNANIEIVTTQKNLKLSADVRITFNGYNNYGTVTIINDGIDPKLFPEIFMAQQDDFAIANDSRLVISGNHTNNAKIGQYTVKITPI